MQFPLVINWLVRRLGDVGALAAFAACLYYRKEISANFTSGTWNLSNFYGAIFDWAAIQTGFVFGVYTYIVSKSAGFSEAIKGTEPYAEMILFIKTIFYLVFALAVISIPLLVMTPKPEPTLSTTTILFAAWTALVVFTFFSFLRIIRAFSTIERVKRVGK